MEVDTTPTATETVINEYVERALSGPDGLSRYNHAIDCIIDLFNQMTSGEKPLLPRGIAVVIFVNHASAILAGAKVCQELPPEIIEAIRKDFSETLDRAVPGQGFLTPARSRQN
jgi:hypothetical protein